MHPIQYINEISAACLSYGNSIDIPVPKMAVVGSQSSGKSTVVKRLIGFDVLPMGDNMVTRTPIYVRLYNVMSDTTEIKLYHMIEDGEIITKKQISFKNDENYSGSLNEIKKDVMSLTTEITGGSNMVSCKPIYIDIYSSKVNDFSFVDMPGLVASAANSLPEQIRNLAKNELLKSNTTALVVIKSGIDLATDLGIALINEVKQTCDIKTIGLLTKPDLLNTRLRNNLNYIIEGKMIGTNEPAPSTEVMSDGYFVIANKIEEADQNEETENLYFNQNFSGSLISNSRFGMKNLRPHLYNYLMRSISESIPIIRVKLNEVIETKEKKLHNLGKGLKTDDEKIAYFIEITAKFVPYVCSEIDNIEGGYNFGCTLRELQNSLMHEVTTSDPFINVSDEYYNNYIKGSQGHRQISDICIDSLIDKCMKDTEVNPIQKLHEISHKYIGYVCQTLNHISLNILNCEDLESLKSYDKLKKLIAATITQFINELEHTTAAQMKEQISIEGSYFYISDINKLNAIKIILKQSQPDAGLNKKFMMNSNSNIKMTTENNFNCNADQLRRIMSTYFMHIADKVIESTIKTVQCKIILAIKNNIYKKLNLLLSQDLNRLKAYIVEKTETQKERDRLNSELHKLNDMRVTLGKLEMAFVGN